MNRAIIRGEYDNGYIRVKRKSGNVDVIPVKNCHGKYVEVVGSYVSYRQNGKLLLAVEADEIRELIEPDYYNEIILEGVLTNNPVIRQTPNGRVITDAFILVDRRYFIPCIAWEDNACYLSELSKGDIIRVAGRIQSRSYGDNKTAYEVSIHLIELLKKQDK